MIPYPDWWKPHYNPSVRCDTINGPCSCGAWHDFCETWVRRYMSEYGWPKKKENKHVGGESK